jgi:uncharacterized protein YkwD
MLFFLNIPEKGCISGIVIPSLATHMGRLGALNDPFPDSGALAVRIGDAWSVSDPCCSQEFCPLERSAYSSRNHNSTWTRTILRVWLGCAVLLACTATSEAQTYYYYPSSGTNAPGFTAAPMTAPTYYHRRGLFGRAMRPTYSTQYYQTAVAPQVYQPAVVPQYQVAQPAVAQNAQVVPVSYSPSTGTAEPTTAAAEPAAATPAAATATTVSVENSDPYGFLSWLNATRASYGLPAVGHDPNLSGWAAENNNHQAARGMGHFVMGPARRQNAAFGSFGNIGSMWMNSPAHRAALLDPTIRWMGIAGLGAYWTFNAY